VIDTGRLLTFILTSFVLIITPGPSVLFVVSRAVAWGRRAALLTVVGNAAGFYVQVSAVAFGIGVVVQQSVLVFYSLKLAGAGYLIYLGIHTIRDRARLVAALRATAIAPKSATHVARQGFMVGLTNPKSMVFLTAILPEFVNRSQGHVPTQLLLFGLVFVLMALVCDSMWGLAAGTARDWFARSPRRLRVLGGTGGLVMIGLGLDLATSGRKR
jgi:threonine/homoserine/homoserine lactone efflux protein